MAKTNSNFNLSKSVKKLASGILDVNNRRKFLNLMIQAEAAESAGKNRKFSDPSVSQKSGKDSIKE